MTDESIFAEVLRIADPGERAAFLDRACAGKPELRREIGDLLDAHAVSNPLDRPPADLARTGSYESDEADPPPAAVGDRVGPYRLMEQIGEGGFGLVFVAEQQEPVRRKVALKVLKPGMDTRSVVARFEAERQALALMDHPNIARVFDAGATPEGRPYFVMELVRGVPITEYCDRNKLAPRERLALFIQVCRAVQHAHTKGVIHRDLKPSNILVASHDGVAVPKVIDFGVAKAVGQQLTDKTIYTRFAQMIGTPLYMSPEQAELSGLDIDTRSDVYSLGVLLYELLTGSTPFDRERFRKAAYDEIRRIIREEEPPRPSTRLTSLGETLSDVSANRQTEPGKLAGLVRGELDWIVMKALEKDRNRRYETANGFAADVERYLAGEPVQAVPPTLGYRLRKFARRNRGPVAAASVILLALLVGIAGMVWGLVEARRQRDHADSQRRDAEIARGLEAEQRGIVEGQKVLLEEKIKEADEARLEADLELHDNQRLMLRDAWEATDVAKLRATLDRMRTKAVKTDLRGFETHYLDRVSHPETDCTTYQLREPVTNWPTQEVHGDTWGPMPGRIRLTHRLAANQHYFAIDALDVATGKPAAGFAPIRGRWNHQQFNRSVYAVPGDPTRIFASAHIHPAHFFVQPPDHSEGNNFGLPQQDLTAWDARTGQKIAHCERFTPDAGLTAEGWRHRFISAQFGFNLGQTCNRDTTLVMTQMARPMTKPEPGKPTTYESRLQIHEMKTGKAVRCLEARPGVIERAHFSFDEKYIVTSHRRTDWSGFEFTVWDALTGRPVWSRNEQFRGFTIDGVFVEFGSPNQNPNQGEKKVFRLATGEPHELPTTEPVFFHPPPPDDLWRNNHPRLKAGDGSAERLFGALSNLNPRWRWFNERGDVVSASETTREYDTPHGRVREGTFVVNTSRPAPLEVWPLPAGDATGFVDGAGGPRLLTSRTAFAWIPFLGQVRLECGNVLDLQSGRVNRISFPPQFSDPAYQLNWDPVVARGDTLLRRVSFFEGYDSDTPRDHLPALVAYDLRTGGERFRLPLPPQVKRFFGVNSPNPCALSPDGTALAILDLRNDKLRLLDAASGGQKWETPIIRGDWSIRGTDADPLFSPDGSLILLVNKSTGLVRAFDAAGGRPAGQVTGLPEPPKKQRFVHVQDAAFTPDGRLLVCRVRGQLAVIDTTDWKVRRLLGTAVTEEEWLREHGFDWGIGQLSNRFVLRQPATGYQANAVVECEVWDLHTGTRWSQFELNLKHGASAHGVGECQFTADGSRLFVLSNGVVHIVDLLRGREVLRIPRGTMPNPQLPPSSVSYASHMSLSADGRALTVYTAYPDAGTVAKRIYDARPLTEEELARARRIHEIQTRPFPPASTEPAPKKPAATASEYFDLARQLPGDPKAAAAALREAIKLDPDFCVLHSALARVLEAQGDADGALQEYREAVRLMPRDVASHYHIGLILQRRRDWAGMAAALREAFRHDRRNGLLDAGVEGFGQGADPPTRSWMHLTYADALRELGHWGAAEREYREAMRLDPQLDFIINNLCVCLIRQGKLKEAGAEADALVKRLEDAVGKEPNNPEKASRLAQRTLDIGAMYLWQHRYAEADAWCARAAKLFTDYYRSLPKGRAVPDEQKQLRWTHWNRGVALNWLDRGAEALAEMELSLKYTPEAERLNPQMNCARYMAKAGDHKAATRRVKELIDKPPAGDLARWFYWDAALAYALSAGLVKGDEKLQTAYAEEAVALLRRALEAGFDDLALFKKDADLNPIRGRADFKQFVADLEAKVRPRETLPPPRETRP